ncbi:hypothetical protein J2N86_02695 [Legionella lytica]|uniref:Coiled coil protein n=1 Tax=Legionella lytica TaxID=96232 RepID=A0ABY4Y9I5_9GAMM|nr:biogenesis of lysosome-related organelles complex 1 subunit 2 [Legionella lytica]USQ14260.1 hypothetical protein J2N86_02695 [Legionella lytica]
MGNTPGSKFFNADNAKEKVQRLIRFLKAEPQISEINTFSQKLEQLRENLAHAKTTDRIVAITYQMIGLQKEIRSYLETQKADLQIIVDPRVERKLLQLLERQENAGIRILFAYTDMATKSISEAVEQVAMEDMYSSLSEENKTEAQRFIHSLSSLQPFAQQMNTKYKEFAEILDQVDSMDEIDAIEQHIDSLNSIFVKELPKLIYIPRDQETFRAVMEVVKKNPNLSDILLAFKPQKVLFNNIMDAKTEVILNATPSL